MIQHLILSYLFFMLYILLESYKITVVMSIIHYLNYQTYNEYIRK